MSQKLSEIDENIETIVNEIAHGMQKGRNSRTAKTVWFCSDDASCQTSVNSIKGQKTAKCKNSNRGVVRQNSVSISDFLTRVDEQVFRAMKKIAIVFHELEETFLPEIFNEENN